jgi:hypothetical protein
MGAGSWSASSFASYSVANNKSYDEVTGRVIGQVFTKKGMDAGLDPKNFKIRECVDTEEHPNTVPVILALDVTGSMGSSCKETAETLGIIMTNLYKKYKDIEFCVMGIGDLAYDWAPIQMSQFESDIRIAEALDNIYIEGGGGGNRYESYTAAWWMALNRTKLDCHKRGKKGIIITLGDEPMNPYLPADKLKDATGDPVQADINTPELYEEASKKFDIYHIAVGDSANMYKHYAMEIAGTFGQLLGDRLKVSSINELSGTIEDCIDDSLGAVDIIPGVAAPNVNENGEISW